MNERERKALEAIHRIFLETGFTPSSRQLAKELHCGGTPAFELIQRLESKGYVIFHTDRKRYMPFYWRQLVADSGFSID